MEIHEASTNEIAAQLLLRVIKEAGGDEVVKYNPSLMLRIQAHLSVALLEMHINHSRGN